MLPMINFKQALASSSTPEDRLRAATAPDTPQEVLEKLVTDPESAVRKAVAANPNITPELVNLLVSEFPDVVMANPALDHFPFEDPEWIGGLSKQAQRAVCKHPLLSDASLHWIVNQEDSYLRIYLLRNPVLRCGDDIAALTRGSNAPYYRGTGYARQPSPAVHKLTVLSRCPCYIARHFAAADERTPVDDLKRLALDPELLPRYSAARNAYLPLATTELLYRAGAKSNFAGVSGHYGPLTEDEQTYLMEAEGPYGRRLLARRHDITTDQIAQLAADPDAALREELGRNPIVPIRTLLTLLFDEAPDVRAATLENPKIPKKASVMTYYLLACL